MTLSERITQPDVASLPDWRVAEILNSPDTSFPPAVTITNTLVGPGVFLSVLGGNTGAAFLNTLEQLATTIPLIRWAMVLINNGTLNLGDSQVRQVILDFSVSGGITQEQVSALLAVAEHHRPVSWAEHYGIEVTARTVGLARGAV